LYLFNFGGKMKVRITGGVLLIMVGMGFVMPALAQLRDLGMMTGPEVALLFLGVVLTLAGGGALAWAAKRRWA
jgi:hypothetical protein